MTTAQIYFFSIFVFAMLCALIIIWWRLVIRPRGRNAASAQDEAASKEKEERLFRLYQNIEEMMDNFEAYIEDAREEVDSVKRQMQLQAEGINDMIKRVEVAEAGARESLAAMRAKDEPEHAKKKDAVAEEPAEAPAGKHGTKRERIRELLDRGMTPVQIARKMELSVNEVKLIAYGLSKRVEPERAGSRQVLDALRSVDAQEPEEAGIPEEEEAPRASAGKHEAKREAGQPERSATALDPKMIWQDTKQAGQEPPRARPEPKQEIRLDARYEAVRKLLEKGYTIKQIAKKLKLSIYEVRLIVYGMAKNTGK
jgi:DNA-binding NarL/FixJ family response regulator